MPPLFDLGEQRDTQQDIAGYALVALEQGIDDTLTYAVPAAMNDLAVGDRVLVPLGRGNKPVAGYVMGRMPGTDVQRVKLILDRDRSGVALTPDLVQLARWIADYYCCPLGMVFVTMLPAAVKHGTGATMITLVRFAQQPPEKAKLSTLQQAAVDALQERAAAGEPLVEIKRLADLAGARSVSPVKQLIAKGVLVTEQQSAVRARGSDIEAEAFRPPTLTDTQRGIVDDILSRDRGFHVHLLHGVTGSGKTEVYLRVLAELTADDRGAIVLVPEIALTPQTVARFLSRFDKVAVMHSGLTAAQRHEQWQRIRKGEANVVIGARSAVFAPLKNLGVIVVDEEHESSYKQDQLPRYHARDVAIKRAQFCAAPILLGSATPSMESYFNAATERHTHFTGLAPDARKFYTLHRLPDRVPGLRLPRVETVDLTEERRRRQGIHLLSRRLEQALHQTLDAGGQAIILLNRRGYANYVACPDHTCGWTLRCNHCDVTMVYHKDKRLPTGGYVRCHHCNAETMLPAQCPVSQHKVTTFGLGTQRVEGELERKFAQLETQDPQTDTRLLARMDSDTMHTARDYQQTLDAFRRGDIRVLLGTQMIAKGLDFPNVQLVGIISADTSLHFPDFRAAERTFQLISQVAGRAGRSDQPGTVIVQTFNPDDPTIQLAAEHNYDTFAAQELQIRSDAPVPLPPVGRMARIVVRHRDHPKCHELARSLYDELARCNARHNLGVTIRPPIPCPLSRLADHYREQVELMTGPPRAAARLQQLLRGLRTAGVLKSDAHTAVDVDPVSLL